MRQRLDVTGKRSGELLILTAQGELDAETAPRLVDAIGSSVRTPRLGSIAIDLGDCDSMDSAGLACLAEGRVWARDRGLMFAVISAVGTQPYRLLWSTGTIPEKLLRFSSRGAAIVALGRRSRVAPRSFSPTATG